MHLDRNRTKQMMESTNKADDIMNKPAGPLKGYRIIELAGVGPTQLTGMLLADMGADIIRLERLHATELGVSMPEQYQLLNRSRRSIAIDLKQAQGVETVLSLCEQADALFEGFRPGVMEGLGLSPQTCMNRNPALVYGRMTGWGQEGPLARQAGHDPNYIAVAGALGLIGEADGAPIYPLNMLGDFGGGALYLATGLLAALLESAKSGCGQVVDAAMVDGVASMLSYFYGLQAAGLWQAQRASNILDGGAHFLRPYQTRDGEYIVIGAVEGRFYQLLLDQLGIDDADLRQGQFDSNQWPQLQKKLQAIFLTKTREEWCQLAADSDSCLSPVLSLDEASRHPHARARNSYLDIEGITQPAPAPRFTRTPSAVQSPPPRRGQHSVAALQDWGIADDRIRSLIRTGIIRQYEDSTSSD